MREKLFVGIAAATIIAVLIMPLFMGTPSARADGCVSPPTTNFSSTPQTLTTTPALISARRCRNAITILNTGTPSACIGTSTSITTSTAGCITTGLSLTLQTAAPLYGVSTGSDTIEVFETY